LRGEKDGQVEGLSLFPTFRIRRVHGACREQAWGAWHVINDGRRLSLDYVSDGFYDYLKHLLHSLMCRELVGLNFPTVLVWFRGWMRQGDAFFGMLEPKGKGADGDEPKPQQNCTAEGQLSRTQSC
jgi:hypothetical protein